MKTSTNRSIRQALLATIAVAGLVAGTAACGGKNDTSVDTEKQQLVELLLSAARSGDQVDIADIIAEADPALVAQILPEIDEVVAVPELGTDLPADTVAPDAEVAPEAETVAPEAPADDATDEAAPAESESSDDNWFPNFPIVSLPFVPLVVPTPQVEGVTFTAMGDATKVTVMINEKSSLDLADIVEVKISYEFLGTPIVDLAVQGGEVGPNVWAWSVGDTVIENDTDVTITVKNSAGKIHVYTTTATLSAPI